MDKNHILFIGLNGYAGSGKDTVAKMLRVIFNKEEGQTKEFLYNFWKNYHKEHRYATSEDNGYGNTYTIAFADQLKKIASDIFAIPLRRFYDNKTNGYINISGSFEYTENKPDNIITAEDYASSPEYYQKSDVQWWMSIREILVYVGTYILQAEINRKIFINIVENKVAQESRYDDYKYVICTDVRFEHESEYIRNKKGVLINIVRSDVEQLDNVAEHDLDDEEDYDFIIENDGSYEELWDAVWNLVHDNDIFRNEIIQLESHDYSNNYLRLVDDISDIEKTYRICMEYACARASHNEDGSLAMIDPSGGPALYIGKPISSRHLDWKIEKIFTEINPFGFYVTLKKSE